MKNIVVSGSKLVLVALAAALGAAACGGSGSGDTAGGGGAGGSSTSTDASSTDASSTNSASSTNNSSSSVSSASSSSGTGGMVAPGLIDDMEDKNDSILTAEGRQGYWYSYSDETVGGTITPTPNKGFPMTAITPPRDASTYAAHIAGMGFTNYGAGMGFDLNATSMMKTGYDASGYSGVTFFARVGKGTATALRVNVSDKDTAPEGGVCKKCNDHFGANITLTEDWKQYTLKFSELKQAGYGDPAPKILTNALYGMSFAVGPKLIFDVWIDDLAFVK